MSQLKTLDKLGIRHITDKCSLEHDYLHKYERLFEPFRDAPLTLLEIGVFNGGSLRLWEEYFPCATIVGLDIDPACKQYEGGRRVVEIGSQSDAAAIEIIGRKYKPHIIIDDGSHQADHILISFETLYPLLASGGIYIVEDIGIHSGSTAAAYRGSAPMSPQEYFLNLARRIACPADDVPVNRRIARVTETVEFFQDAAVIRKKEFPEPDRIEIRRALVQELDSHHLWGWLSLYIIHQGGPLDQAIEAAKRAMELEPSEPVHYTQLSEALERAGRLDEALTAARQAAQIVPGHFHLVGEVSRLEAKLAIALQTP